MFGAFRADKAKAFGKSLAIFFIENVPRDDQIKEKKFAAKTEKVLLRMHAQIVRFRIENKLNTYQKAQLGNTFKWELKEAGFSREYAEHLTDWLIVQVS